MRLNETGRSRRVCCKLYLIACVQEKAAYGGKDDTYREEERKDGFWSENGPRYGASAKERSLSGLVGHEIIWLDVLPCFQPLLPESSI